MSTSRLYHAFGIRGYQYAPTDYRDGENTIKTMKCQAHGFRNLEFFKLKILAIHETTYALVG